MGVGIGGTRIVQGLERMNQSIFQNGPIQGDLGGIPLVESEYIGDGKEKRVAETR